MRVNGRALQFFTSTSPLTTQTSSTHRKSCSTAKTLSFVLPFIHFYFAAKKGKAQALRSAQIRALADKHCRKLTTINSRFSHRKESILFHKTQQNINLKRLPIKKCRRQQLSSSTDRSKSNRKSQVFSLPIKRISAYN